MAKPYRQIALGIWELQALFSSLSLLTIWNYTYLVTFLSPAKTWRRKWIGHFSNGGK